MIQKCVLTLVIFVVCVSLCCAHEWGSINNKRKKRQLGNENIKDCQFFADVSKVGEVQDLNVDESNVRAPIVYYQTRPVGATTRTEAMEAHIYPAHLNQGTEVTDAVRRHVQTTLGTKDDDSGHILANQLGGPGNDIRNVFPQTPHFNRGSWRDDVETTVYEMVDGQHGADGIRFNVNLVYRELTDTRPYEILYRIANLRTDYVYQVGDFTNVVVPEDMIKRKCKTRASTDRDIFKNSFVDPNNWHGVPIPDKLTWVNADYGSHWRRSD